MSPVAVDRASADSAPGALAPALVAVEAVPDVVAGGAVVLDAAAGLGEEDEEPHPDATADSMSVTATAESF